MHWDYLYLGTGYGDTAYLLVIKDELSHFCELVPCATPTTFVAAEALAMWCAWFGVPEMLLSDQGSHFRNEMINHFMGFTNTSGLNTNAEPLEFVSGQGVMLGVEGFSDYRFNETFNRHIESSWELLTTLLQDVPTKMQEYAMACGDDTLRSQLD
ncbi:Hypothetical protein PHPALM_14190 [Phytophthora palmivora]|uniref:Integrase catalytic domain-containing protein n=1 Tax=Phytophthora palmivora TaxID=4796 RepID=A0A2P4XVD2_9STRA|nr:Hypothetical protein PHPALM_14190 [Phytophthora palmivora]